MERGSEIADSGREDAGAADLVLARETSEALEPAFPGLALVEPGVTMDGSGGEVFGVAEGSMWGFEGVMGLVMLDAAGPWVSPRTKWSWQPSSAISGEAVEGGVVLSGKGGSLIILYKGKG